MALLIDGYNLLHVTGIFAQDGPGTELHRTRLALLNFLSTAIDQRERKATTIVFDAAGAPPGLPGMIKHDGITVCFAQRHSDADEMIEELLEKVRAPRSLLVVSSDHRVQRAARHVGASYLDSEEWYSERLAICRARKSAAEEAAKPSGDLTPDELNYWLQEFGGTKSLKKTKSPKKKSESDSPFPPGYADDLLKDK
jgi:predicted RNA-binding protein with PIN domain